MPHYVFILILFIFEYNPPRLAFPTEFQVLALLLKEYTACILPQKFACYFRQRIFYYSVALIRTENYPDGRVIPFVHKLARIIIYIHTSAFVLYPDELIHLFSDL